MTIFSRIIALPILFGKTIASITIAAIKNCLSSKTNERDFVKKLTSIAMDRDFFVSELSRLMPTEQELKHLNLPESFVSEERMRYLCEPKTRVESGIVAGDEFLALIRDYDCSNAGIGILSFAKKVGEYPGYCKIGNVEMDILVLNKITHEIEVRDHDSLGHVIWECALNGAKFLDALIVCAQYFRSLLNDLSIGDNPAHLLGVVNNATEMAGGDRYIDFYKMLLGYFE